MAESRRSKSQSGLEAPQQEFRPSRERKRAAEEGECRKSNIHVLCGPSPRPLTSGQLVRRRSPGATKVPEAGSAVHGVRLVLEVAVALVDEEGRVQSCLRAAAGDPVVSKERSGGIDGLSARGLPRARAATDQRAIAGTSSPSRPGSGIYAALGGCGARDACRRCAGRGSATAGCCRGLRRHRTWWRSGSRNDAQAPEFWPSSGSRNDAQAPEIRLFS